MSNKTDKIRIKLLQSFIGDDSEDEDRMDHFDKPWTSVFKTFTMFIGELEFSDLPIDSSDSLAFFNFTFLILFVFMTIVVLMNLLNGLAVSDVGELLAEAEIISIKSRSSIAQLTFYLGNHHLISFQSKDSHLHARAQITESNRQVPFNF